MPDYTLRGIDVDTWDAVKERAATDGHSLRFVLLMLCELYVAHGLPILRQAGVTRQALLALAHENQDIEKPT